MSDSESSSSSSSSVARKRARREEKKRKKRKDDKRKDEKRKDEKRKKHKESKHGKRKKHKSEPEHRSVITGKRIKRADGAAADADGEARRQAMLAAMNEGEDDDLVAAASQRSAPPATSSSSTDPARMLELMRQSDAAQRAKQQRLAALVSGDRGAGADGYGDGTLPGAQHVRPHDYKRERAAQEAAGLR